MAEVKQYIGTPGEHIINDPDLRYKKILKCTRNDKVFRQIGTLPSGGDMDFQYDAASGDIIFDPDVPFNNVDFATERANLEKVKVIYK